MHTPAEPQMIRNSDPPIYAAGVDYPWHTLTGEQVQVSLDVSERGLSEAEAARRTAAYGLNVIPEPPRTGWPVVFISQFKSALIYVLLAASVLSVVIGEYSDAGFIMAVLMINALVGTVQEYKAETSARALGRIVRISARVLRDGRRRTIDSGELVPGDIVLLEAGDAVPADMRLLYANEAMADESLLTGESMPVHKQPQILVPDPRAAVADRRNMLHAGTHLVEGRARGVVCRTGMHTEVGRIAASLSATPAPPPLVLRLRHFTFVIAVVTLSFITLLAIGQLLRGAGIIETFFLAVALAVAAIPEGLPVAITVALAIGSHRMAQRHVIVRLLPAVEGLGTCTLIASDKTGTLTANKLTAKRLILPDGYDVDIAGEGFDPHGDLTHNGGPLDPTHQATVRRLVTAGALCNEAEYWSEGDGPHFSGDTVDVAFLVLAAKLGLTQAALARGQPPLGAIPFQASRRYAASFNEDLDAVHAHVKGAAETVLPMCRGMEMSAMEDLLNRLTRDGYRVLAVATGDVSLEDARVGSTRALSSLTFLGFVGLIDPVREGVPEALQKCRRAGIEVAMVTGDHPTTALAIARQLGIASSESQVMTGQMIKHLSSNPPGLVEEVSRTRVFARVEPVHKTQIVKAFQDAGHYVAVTGDGVNDAPALRAANIGVAMGRGGTDVARQAADLILTDDNFASIVNGVEEGRVAYSNIRKVTWLLISTGAAEILLFFLSFIFSLPLPLNAVQLLWLNLVTNGIQDVALAFEQKEPSVLDRPPRPPSQPIFDRRMIEQTVLSGAYMGTVAFCVFYWMMAHPGWDEFEARNILLLIMVLFENTHVFNCRSESRAALRIPLNANPLLIFTVVAAQGVHLLAMYTPGLRGVLQIAPVSIGTWLTMLLIAASLIALLEVYKHLRRVV
jgi:Ca2+-transporting ATPase